jgi:ribosomal protein L11 methyltransferase
MPWLALTLEVDGASAEALSEALLESGAQSVSLEALQPLRWRLDALVATDTDADALVAGAARLASLARPPSFSRRTVEDADWVRRSQAQFAPIPVGERLLISPTWCEPRDAQRALVRLDPGLAFGTGSHPSTRLVLNFLEQRVRGGESVLDYGCGSGILAIAAAKLGASRVDAVDLDPEAVQAAAANIDANVVPVRVAAPDELAPALYDMVVANILAQPLILLAPLLAARTRRGGAIALSGILAAQAAEVVAVYSPFFDAAVAGSEEGWALVAGQRR